jgi:hypothetical protein
VTFTVSDGALPPVALPVVLRVKDVNRPPNFLLVGKLAVGEDPVELAATEGTALQAIVTAGDPDTDNTLTLTAANLPDGATLTDRGHGSGIFAWTPSHDQGDPAGPKSYDIPLTVADDRGGSDTMTLRVSVTDVNRPPAFLADTADQTVSRGYEDVRFGVDAADPDADTLTLSLAVAAAEAPDVPLDAAALGIAFTDDGHGHGDVLWLGEQQSVGTFLMTITARDAHGDPANTLEASQTVQVEVLDNAPPDLDVTIEPEPAPSTTTSGKLTVQN